MHDICTYIQIIKAKADKRKEEKPIYTSHICSSSRVHYIRKEKYKDEITDLNEMFLQLPLCCKDIIPDITIPLWVSQ